MKVSPDKWQWLIDLLFGAILITPIGYTALTGDIRGTYIAVGISAGYVLHVTHKMLLFQDMLEKTVKEEAKDRVEKEAEARVEEKVEETVTG